MEVIGTQLDKIKGNELKQSYILELLSKQAVRLPDDVLNYPVQDMISVICKNQERYLVLRFSNNYDYCPGDWDFVTRHPHTEMTLEENAVEAVKHHITLSGKIKNVYPKYIWLDLESKIWWHYIPFLMETTDKNVRLRENGKYSEVKWVDKRNITKFSRLNYLENAMEKTIGTHL